MVEQMTRGIVAAQPITLTLSAAEAMFTLDALTQRAAKSWENVRKTEPGSEEREICETSARLLDAVHRRLDSLVFPVCRWTDDPDCMAPVAGTDSRGVAFCDNHLAARRRIEAALDTVGLPW